MVNARARLALIPLLIALSAATTGCGRAAQAAEPDGVAAWRFKVLVPPEGVAILPESLTTALLAPCAGRAARSVTSGRLVGRNEIARLDEALALEIARQLEQFPLNDALPDSSLAAQARTYYAQVVGIERDGRRLLYVNGFASDVVRALDDSTAWHYEPVIMCTGGQAFFGAEYDSKTRTLSGFSFNPGTH